MALHSSGRQYFSLPMTMAFVMINLDFIVVCGVNFLMLYNLLLMLDVICEICLSWFRFDCIVYPRILTFGTCLTLCLDTVIWIFL